MERCFAPCTALKKHIQRPSACLEAKVCYREGEGTFHLIVSIYYRLFFQPILLVANLQRDFAGKAVTDGAENCSGLLAHSWQ